MASKYSSLSPEILENIIQCPICFNNDVCLHLPRCQHRICQKCIDGIKKRSTGKFICPNCREESSGIFPICRLTEFMRNESLQENKIKPYSDAKPSSCTNCQLCERVVEADMRCTNCKKFICYRCSKSLSCGTRKKNHICQDVVDLETESKGHLKLWTDQAIEQIARRSKCAHQLQGDIDKLNEEIHELEIQKSRLQKEKNRVDMEIKEQS